MLGNFFENLLTEDEKELEEKETKTELKGTVLTWNNLKIPLLVFLVALIPRLLFMFINDPENVGYAWYGDVYHRWQIAYLSWTVGFKQGFLRLWDLKGMEYFWGLLFPLVSIFLFIITGSVDIVLIRLLSIICGALVVALIFLLVKRDFNTEAAWAAALFLAIFPVIFFSDTVGMQEPLGLALLLGGIIIWPKKGILVGILWGLASMTRAEYWLFAFALATAALFDKQSLAKLEAKISMFITYLLIIGLYMKYLIAWTNNYIYPIYWNFLASVIGLWFKKGAKAYLPAIYLSKSVIFFRIVFFINLIFVLLVFLKRKRYYLWFLLGFFNLVFISFMFGFAAYTWGYIDRFWIDRLLSWPYGFLGIILSVILLYTIPGKLKFWRSLKLGWFILLFVLAVSFLLWKPIHYYFEFAQAPWKGYAKMAEDTAEAWDGKGKILVPENMPAYVYALVRYQGVKGPHITGQMFDIFMYLKDPFDNWSENWPKIKAWLQEEDISLIVTHDGKADYFRMYKLQPDDFKLVKGTTDFKYFQPTWRKEK